MSTRHALRRKLAGVALAVGGAAAALTGATPAAADGGEPEPSCLWDSTIGTGNNSVIASVESPCGSQVSFYLDRNFQPVVELHGSVGIVYEYQCVGHELSWWTINGKGIWAYCS